MLVRLSLSWTCLPSQRPGCSVQWLCLSCHVCVKGTPLQCVPHVRMLCTAGWPPACMLLRCSQQDLSNAVPPPHHVCVPTLPASACVRRGRGRGRGIVKGRGRGRGRWSIRIPTEAPDPPQAPLASPESQQLDGQGQGEAGNSASHHSSPSEDEESSPKRQNATGHLQIVAAPVGGASGGLSARWAQQTRSELHPPLQLCPAVVAAPVGGASGGLSARWARQTRSEPHPPMQLCPADKSQHIPEAFSGDRTCACQLTEGRRHMQKRLLDMLQRPAHERLQGWAPSPPG